MKHGLSLASVLGAFLTLICFAEVPAPYGQVDATKDDPVLYGRHCKRYTDANPSKVSFTTPASSYSFAAWVCPESVTNRVIFARAGWDFILSTAYNDKSRTRGKFAVRFWYLEEGKSAAITTYDVGNATGYSRLETNQWVHIAFTHDYDNRQLVWYVQGKPVQTNSYVGVPKGFAQPKLGQAMTDVKNPFVGGMDRVRIWNGVLTPEQLAEEFAVSRKPCFVQDFTDSATVIDGIHAKVVDATGEGVTMASYDVNRLVYGTKDYPYRSESFSIAFRFRPENYQGYLLHRTGYNFELYLNSSGNLVTAFWGGYRGTGPAQPLGATVISSAVLPLNVWQHVAITYDETTRTIRYYLNGNKCWEKLIWSDYPDGLYAHQSQFALRFGYSDSLNANTSIANRGRGKCAFANIHYWAVPLTDEEVARDYQHPGLVILVR